MAQAPQGQDQLGQESQCPSSSKYEMLIKGLKNMSQELRSMITTTNNLIEELNADLENIEQLTENFENQTQLE